MAGGLAETAERSLQHSMATRSATYMLDAYVIEEIKRRDREQHRDDRPVVELPIPARPERSPTREREDDDDRDPGSVVIIDYS